MEQIKQGTEKGGGGGGIGEREWDRSSNIGYVLMTRQFSETVEDLKL